MKLNLFNFRKSSNFNRNLYYNKPLKNSVKIPSNYVVKQEDTTVQLFAKFTEALIQRLKKIEEKNEEILVQLKSLSRK